MSINATLLGTIVLVLVPVFALVSYFLGKRKPLHPLLLPL